MIKTLPYDEHVVLKYQTIVLHVYDIVKKFTNIKEKIGIENVVLGVLYKLRTGLQINGIQVLTVDPSLIHILLKPNDLPIIGVDKKILTKSVSAIKLAYNEAIHRNIRHYDLLPDMSIVNENQNGTQDDDVILYPLGGVIHTAKNRM